jgi:tetratricopeptide (TPR) repeat protein
MKKLSLLIFLISNLVVPLTASYGAELPKVAVWDLTSGEIKAAYAQDLTLILGSEVSKLGKYEVYSQENVRTLAGWTAERMQIGCTDTKCLTALGQMDIAKLISGRVGKIGNRFSVSLSLFDTQNAKAEKMISEFCQSEDELIEMVQVAVRKLLGAPTDLSVTEERRRLEAEQKEKASSLVEECNRINRAEGPRAALPVCKEAVKLNPKNFTAHYNLGVVLRTQYGSSISGPLTGDEMLRGCKEAIPEFEEAIRLGKDLDAHTNLALCYNFGKEHRKAINILEEGMRTFPDYRNMPFLYSQLGSAYYQLNEYAKALTYYQKAKDGGINDPVLEEQLRWLKQRVKR